MILSLLAQFPTTAPVAGAVPVDDILSPYVYVFYAAFLVSYAFTPIMRQVALYYEIIDEPDAIRKLHTSPVAYLGGVAVFLGWIAGLAISQLTTDPRGGPSMLHLVLPVPIVLAAFTIVILGLWDDIQKAKPWLKILVQILAGVALLYGHVGTHLADLLMEPVKARMTHYLGWDPSWFPSFSLGVSGVLTILLVVGCCNATNLMDGLDGLCGGVTAVIASGFVFLAIHMATYGTPQTLNADATRVVLGLALLGATLGFVPYNFNPASIFLGDTGSMFIGFACATLIVTMAEENPKWFLAAMVMFALPIMDTALAFARRWLNRRPLFSADRHHFHHQLVARGFTVKQTVVISYALAFCFAILGTAIVFIRVRYVVAVYLVVFGSIIVAAYKMGMVHEKARVVSRRSIGDEEGVRPVSSVEASEVLDVRT